MAIIAMRMKTAQFCPNRQSKRRSFS